MVRATSRCLTIAFVWCCVFCGIVVAQQPLPSATTTSPSAISEDRARASVQWLASLALEKLPQTFHGDKDWGDQKKLWAGVKVKFDGLRPKTHRRWREVNHGRWLRYQVKLPDPSRPDAAEATVHNVVATTDPQSGQQRWQIDSSITAPMTFTAQIQRWNLGVKLYSVTIHGSMRLRLVSTMSVGFVADYLEVPPALVVDPQMQRAHLVLENFRVNRVSKVGGEVAQQWGELMEEVIRDRFLHKQNEKLTAKLNRAIDKERDDLRLSLAEWFESW